MGAASTGDFNLKQVAASLGVHYVTAYRYVRTGRLPARRVGTGWVVDPEDLAAFAAWPGMFGSSVEDEVGATETDRGASLAGSVTANAGGR